MRRVLRLIHEIQESTNSSKESIRGEVVRKTNINNDPKEEARDFVVLLASNTREVGDSIHE